LKGCNSVKKFGFTIIELAIVILIAGLLLTIGMPRLGSLGPKPGEQFVTNLNALTQEGAREAQYLSKVQKIIFDFTVRKVELWDSDGKRSKKFIKMPDILDIKDFSINQKSQLGQGVKKNTAYFLINSQGITQDVKIFLIDHSVKSIDSNAGFYDIILNPITAKFNVV